MTTYQIYRKANGNFLPLNLAGRFDDAQEPIVLQKEAMAIEYAQTVADALEIMDQYRGRAEIIVRAIDADGSREVFSREIDA